jgi:hypothetical protein
MSPEHSDVCLIFGLLKMHKHQNAGAMKRAATFRKMRYFIATDDFRLRSKGEKLPAYEDSLLREPEFHRTKTACI